MNNVCVWKGKHEYISENYTLQLMSCSSAMWYRPLVDRKVDCVKSFLIG